MDGGGGGEEVRRGAGEVVGDELEALGEASEPPGRVPREVVLSDAGGSQNLGKGAGDGIQRGRRRGSGRRHLRVEAVGV